MKRIWLMLVMVVILSACGGATNAAITTPLAIETQQIEPLPPEGAELVYPVNAGQMLQVFGLSEGDSLSVLSEPGGGALIDVFSPGEAVRTTAEVAMALGEEWLQLETPEGIGWGQAQYLTEVVSAEEFCLRDDVQVLVADLMVSMSLRDRALLSDLVSPVHGLTIYHEWWNPAVAFSRGEVADLFVSEDVYNWGVQDGSGMLIEGSFSEIVLPKIDTAFDGFPTLHCNDLENGSGPSAGSKVLPYAYEDLNYYVLYRAAPEEQEFDWGAWVIGVEFIQGRPYVLFMVQYHWEI